MPKKNRIAQFVGIFTVPLIFFSAAAPAAGDTASGSDNSEPTGDELETWDESSIEELGELIIPEGSTGEIPPEDPLYATSPPGATYEQLRFSEEFDKVSDFAEMNYPDEFSFAEIDLDLLSGVIGFRAEVPSDDELLSMESSSIDLLPEVGYSQNSLRETIVQVGDEISTLPGVSSVGIGQENNEGALQIEIGYTEEGSSSLARTDDATDIAEIASNIAKEITDSQDLDFTINVFEGEVMETTAHTAGGRLYTSTQARCTASFPVKSDLGPEIGVLTAGHCGYAVKYNTTTNPFYPAAPYSQITDDLVYGGDFRWFHSKDMFNGRTFIGNNQSVIFRQTASSKKSNTVCMYGHTTAAKKCGSVTDVSYYTWFDYPSIGTRRVGPLIKMNGIYNAKGDSGGPVYRGSNAVGIQTGYTVHPDTGKPQYTLYSNVQSALHRFGLHLWVG